jgi:hypothetical protein
LDIVQSACGLFTVARDKRDSRALVEERYCGGDLIGLGGNFEGETGLNGRQHELARELKQERAFYAKSLQPVRRGRTRRREMFSLTLELKKIRQVGEHVFESNV